MQSLGTLPIPQVCVLTNITNSKTATKNAGRFRVIDNEMDFRRHWRTELNLDPSKYPSVDFNTWKVIQIDQCYEGTSLCCLGLLSAVYESTLKTVRLTTAFFGDASCTNKQPLTLLLTIPKPCNFELKHHASVINFNEYPRISQIISQMMDPRSSQLTAWETDIQFQFLDKVKNKLRAELVAQHCGTLVLPGAKY